MFSTSERDRLRDRVLELAMSDPRVVAGAIVGSLAHDDGDRWSDLDLTFAVTKGARIPDVLEDWTRDLVNEFDAVHLFDLPAGASIYRVLLLPGCLQFDLSFTPAPEFGAIGPKFRILSAVLLRNRTSDRRRRSSSLATGASRAAGPLLHRARSVLAG